MLEEEQFQSHYALVAFYTNPKLQEKMQIQCKLNVLELNLKLTCEVDAHKILTV